jgi:hypothetical protein
MFLTVVILFAIAAALAAGIGFWAYRVALHLRGDEEATRAVVRHVLMPLVGRTPQPGNPADLRADAD